MKYLTNKIKYLTFLMKAAKANEITTTITLECYAILLLTYIGWISRETVYFSPQFMAFHFEPQRYLLAPYYSECSLVVTFMLIVILYKVSSKIEDTHFYDSPGSFLILEIYAHVGVLISGFIEPEPGLLPRYILFFLFIFAKLFSNMSIGINNIFNTTIPLTYFPFLYLIIQFLFVTNDRNVSKLFLLFWSHLYLFLRFMSNSITHKKFFQAPAWLDKILFKILIF